MKLLLNAAIFVGASLASCSNHDGTTGAASGDVNGVPAGSTGRDATVGPADASGVIGSSDGFKT